MVYKNVKTQEKALSLTIERMSNGFSITPEYDGYSNTNRADNAMVFHNLADALSEAKRMLEKGKMTEKEEWVDDLVSRSKANY